VIGTLQASAVALIVVFPGACFVVAYEAAARGTHRTGADRLLIALLISATFHATISGGSYLFWRDAIHSGDLRAGRVSPWLVELVSLSYVAIPTAAGFSLGIIGRGKRVYLNTDIQSR
jgi:hypothetical protein